MKKLNYSEFLLFSVILSIFLTLAVFPAAADVIWDNPQPSQSELFMEEHKSEILQYDGCLDEITNGKEGNVDVWLVPDIQDEPAFKKDFDWVEHAGPDAMYIDDKENVWVHMGGYYMGRNDYWVCATKMKHTMTTTKQTTPEATEETPAAKIVTPTEISEMVTDSSETPDSEIPSATEKTTLTPAPNDENSTARSVVAIFFLIVIVAVGAFVLIRVMKKRNQSDE